MRIIRHPMAILKTLTIAMLGCIAGGMLSSLWTYSENISSEEEIELPTTIPQACVHPKLELWHPEIAKHFRDPPPLKCKPDKDWLYIDVGVVKIRPEAIEKHGEIQCTIIPIHRDEGTDFKISYLEPVSVAKEGTKLIEDHFLANCTASDGQTYDNLHSGVRPIQEVHDRPIPPTPANSFGLNVLMFGFDSVSRMTFMRNMKKTYDYYVNTLGAVVLESYNIVGDGTPQQLLPMMTGKTEIELPEARKGKKGATEVDGHPWIWKEYKKLGYVTQWAEGVGTNWGAFCMRMKGFKHQPTDHYQRPFYMELDNQHKKHPKYCLGSEPLHKLMMEWNLDLYRVYPKRPKFSWMWHVAYTHGTYSQARVADHDLLNMIKWLESEGHLDNTLLMLISDHGARFQSVRSTPQGKYEERMPFMSFRFPSWFEKKHPKMIQNLKTNVHRLTSPFDIHETLHDMINFQGAGKGNVSERGISLFKEIPPERTCEHAGIAPHWCACLSWEETSTNDTDILNAAKSLLETINNFAAEKPALCTPISMTTVVSAMRFKPNTNLLSFRRSKDRDGRIPDLSDKMEEDSPLYQVTIRTSPNNGLYEATIKHQIKQNKYIVNDREISRINKYGDQPHCVVKTFPHLRPYCYCKVQLNS